MESTSYVNKNPLPLKEIPPNFQPYPPHLATYEDVVANPQLFMSTLEKFHAAMRTKFMIPIIGGKELDLHKLFVEVTSRGGLDMVIRDRRWKEVTSVFNFPSTATNASFVLRKYYVLLLHHYEQLYFFRACGWTPNATEFLQSPSSMAAKAQGVQPGYPLPGSKPISTHQPMISASEFPREATASSMDVPVVGVIDGKFDGGYLVTVTVGSEKLKGVLYQTLQNPVHNYAVPNNSPNAIAVSGVRRRRRRKKSEIKRRDPAHPKPNRSGYNFFFAEQHARLKPLYPGKDREISRMIGELWNKLQESEKAVYQEQASKDKERYRKEMEDYRERLKAGQVISEAMPLQQRFPEPEATLMDVDVKMKELGGESHDTQDDGSTSSNSDSEGVKAVGGFDMEALPDAPVSNECINLGMSGGQDGKGKDQSKGLVGNTSEGIKIQLVHNGQP